MRKIALLAMATAVAFQVSAGEMTAYQSELASQLDPAKAPSENFDLTKWKINLPIGDKTEARAGKEMEITAEHLNYANYPYVHPEWFYTDPETGAVVFAAPNTGPTTPNSKNTRSELRAMLDVNDAYNYSGPENNFAVAANENAADFGAIGGQLTAALTVDAVSTSGDDEKRGAHAVVIGQIHGSKNEPLKIFYRKMPNHEHGSVFWTYEINPEDKNDRTDIPHDVFGKNDLTKADADPVDGIKLGELFEYDINVVENVMNLTFKRNIGEKDEKVVTFAVDLSKPYPGQEKLDRGYAQDWMYFKAGVYNQCNQGSSGCQNRGIEAGDYTQATFYKLELNQ